MTKPVRGTVVVFGATSAIGRSIAICLGERGHTIVAVARDAEEVDRVARDLAIRTGAAVRTTTFDAAGAFDSMTALDRAGAGERLDGVVIAHGVLGRLESVVEEPGRIDVLARVNFTSAASLAEVAATRLAESGGGFVVVLSSIAGDVGRRTNYPYGATKAGLSVYLQGLRGRVRPLGVDVITVKPGFVDSAMTWGLLDPDSPLVARPDTIARATLRAVDRRAREVYAPGYWRAIATGLRVLPEAALHRLPF